MPEPVDDAIARAAEHRHAGLEQPPSIARRAAIRPLWFTIEQQLRFNEDVVDALTALRGAAPPGDDRLARLEATCHDLDRRSRALHEQLLAGLAALESSLVDVDLELAELRSAIAALGATDRR